MADKFDPVFTRLRSIMRDAAPGMIAMKDLPGGLELRTSAIDPKTKQASQEPRASRELKNVRCPTRVVGGQDS